MPDAHKQAAFLALIREQLPEKERVIVGWRDIHGYLSHTLRLRRRSGQPLTLRQLKRWRTRYGLPVAGGGVRIPGPRGLRRTLCMSTTAMLTAWVLAQRIGRLFCVHYPLPEHFVRAGVREQESVGAPVDATAGSSAS